MTVLNRDKIASFRGLGALELGPQSTGYDIGLLGSTNGHRSRATVEAVPRSHNAADFADTSHHDNTNESRNAVLTSIRETVRTLPQERHAELFADFEAAVKTRNVGDLADTIANWALGGHGYDSAGMVVNHLEPVISQDADAQTLEIWNSFWPSDGE